MHAFDYAAPKSLADAVAQLAEHNGTARPLAGGTDLIDQMRMGRHTPQVVVNIKNIPELNVLELTADGLRLGAAVPCHKITSHAGIREQYTALADSAGIIGGIQIQTRASMGGNLCNSGPAADSTPSLIALGGICVIAGPDGTREVPAEDFCVGPSANVLQRGELLVEIKFPPRPQHSGSHYRRLIPRNEMDIAVVGVGASVQLDDSGQNFADVRVSLGAVAAKPLFVQEIGKALAGQPVNDAGYETAAGIARDHADPISDMRGTRDYRIHVAGVLTKRVLQAAVTRARGEELNYKPGH